ncbi:hypothetical protein [Cyclobacterium xiamenense]|uniref:hypothetical protein n=1 Tax=Cyclobacterium xiamenense TaxID=1297121 RepID=UPI0035CFAAAB
MKRQLKDRPLPQVTEEKRSEPTVSVETPVNPNRSITGEEVQGVLEEVKRAFKEGHKNMEMALLQQPFEVREQQIVFLIHGGLQEDLFPKLKPELTGIFRNKLQHPEVEVNFEVKAEALDPVKSLYTSREKLGYLLEKSPALKELKNRFGLETDF